MAKDAEKITLGAGDLYLNNIEVGYVDEVQITATRGYLDYTPGTDLAPVKSFLVEEGIEVKAKVAEWKVANARLAMGISAAVSASQSFPSYDPSSYSPAASASYDVLKFGGAKTRSEVPLRFEHTRPDGKVIVLVLYSVTSSGDFSTMFNKDNIADYEMTFKALSQSSRTAGDRLGFIAEQVQEAG